MSRTGVKEVKVKPFKCVNFLSLGSLNNSDNLILKAVKKMKNSKFLQKRKFQRKLAI